MSLAEFKPKQSRFTGITVFANSIRLSSSMEKIFGDTDRAKIFLDSEGGVIVVHRLPKDSPEGSRVYKDKRDVRITVKVPMAPGRYLLTEKKDNTFKFLKV